ncbi:hypothetical protein GGS23DRAFT_367061 [Durotheca rogersii]|uniref:uncharacterized protein n=1 Tax=Durotheca rogersii TaxID=419775 RepID=UPI00221F589C|nr:uncharacterized protein GGS23DRAFT_367061 [Durotheca rogersii]KAI5866064.1 hypothetical protein GGS23DRAFT_367061 [Durotheca rogersii]
MSDIVYKLNEYVGFRVDQFMTNTSFKGQCAQMIENQLQRNDSKSTDEIIDGFVDRWGHRIGGQNARGIVYDLCKRYCGRDILRTVFNIETFSSGATNYILPWLALTAQLPFETGEYAVVTNVMAFCYALGSPMLISYSLMLTVLNQYWLRKKFHHLEDSDRPLHGKSKNARIFLQESQQLPLRLSQEDGSLGSLIVLDQNTDWWERLKRNILLTRRGVTLPLVAQMLAAILSWVLTVVASFVTSLGNITQALELSSGTLWIWLIPVVSGWIAVGTQTDHHMIGYALKRDRIHIVGPTRAGSTSSDSPADTPTEHQKAFEIATQRKLLRPLARSLAPDETPHPEQEAEGIPNCLGCSVAGDEKQPGATFNYARVFTWWNVVTCLHGAFETASANLERRSSLDTETVPPRDRLSILLSCGLAKRNGDGIEAKEINEYPSWGSLDADLFKRMILAACMATYVQWGTTGAAIIIALLTEVRGLGCRSGSYIIYGLLSTASFLLLVVSSFLSHEAMLRHETAQRAKALGKPAAARGLLTAFRVSAVATRLLGQVTIVANTVWILVSSMWEITGFYDNCWCNTTYLSKGSNGWLSLFTIEKETAESALESWAGGVFLGVAVVMSSVIVILLYCR